jgi:divalent metal cation (Fe/Co/Zn/Cd) transporter
MASDLRSTTHSDLRLAGAREALIREAFRLEWLTVTWMVIEAAVAIGAGVGASSLTLIAFGADSVIELMSAGVLIWRLSLELKQGRAFVEDIERQASRVAGGLLFLLAAYVIVAAGWGLWRGEGGETFSWPGLVIAVLAMPIMYGLARRKIALAEKIGSRALRADAVESITCGWLSLAVVSGLLAQLAFGFWWIDSVTAFAIVGFLIKEAREAWAGEDCCDHSA